MPPVPRILFGAGFTVAVSLALGALLLRRLRITLFGQEGLLLAFPCGAACLSLATFAVCLAGQARASIFLGLGVLAIALAVWDRRRQPRAKSLPPVPRAWAAFALTLCAPFFVVYFFTALAPEVSPDGSGYHLGNVVRFWRAHGFSWEYHSIYSYLAQGMEMLFLVAFSFGRHSAAAGVHLAFQTVLPLLIVSYGRRFGFPRAGLFGAVLVYASPVAGIDGASAYNDLTVATLLFAVFYVLQVWDENREPNLLILIGLLAGFAFAVKYTAFLAVAFAATYVWWRGSRPVRELAVLTSAATVMILPWALRNWIWVGNPFAPFLNSWFPNPYYHPGMERIYVDLLGHYPFSRHFWEIPLQHILRGGPVGSLMGPVFLLAPLALLALRTTHGRRLLLAALVFSVPKVFNIDTRFLIPSLPFVSLAMGLALAASWGVLPLLAVFHAVVCWPDVLPLYCHPFAWRIGSIPVAAALRRVPEPDFLVSHARQLALKPAIEKFVKPGEKIYSFSGWPEAYIDREIVVMYESVLGNLAQDVLWCPNGERPIERQRFRFLPVEATGARVVQTVSSQKFWTVSEMRLYLRGGEVPRSSRWRVSAWPNSWEAELAFDNNYATRWSTWEAMRPRARLEIEFGRSETLDEVALDCRPVREARLQIEVRNSRGRWVPLTDTLERVELNLASEIRRAATRKLKALGFRYLLINDGDQPAKDMQNSPGAWGITQLAEDNGIRLYRID
jgi:hypothetical protein